MQEVLTRILSGTLSADKPCREAAEHALGALTHQHHDLIVHLIQFAGQELPGWPSSCDRRHSSVLLAAAIRVRNMLCRGNWNRTDTYSTAVKEAVKQSIVSVLCEAHVSEAIRRQLLAAVTDLIGYDYPSNWPYLIPQVNAMVDRCVQELLSAEQQEHASQTLGRQPAHIAAAGNAATSLMPEDASTGAMMTTLLRLKGALSVLRCCCKVHENARDVDGEVTDAFAEAFVPSLCSLNDLLLRWWTRYQSAAAATWLLPDHVTHAGVAALPDRVEDLLELPCPVLAELSHTVRLTLKCLWSLMFHRLPRCLCAVDGFDYFWTTCVTRVATVMQSGVLPWCRARLMVSLTRPDADRGEHGSCFNRSGAWRMLKWSNSVVLKMAQNMMAPKSCEKRARAVATHFCAHLLKPAVADALNLVRWHSEPIPVTSKAYILSLELLCASVDRKDVYTDILLPSAEELMTALLFVRLGFTDDETELWESNPEEYVRRQTSPAENLYSAKVVSCNLLLSFAVPSRKYHNAHLLDSFARFVIAQLESCSPVVAAAAAAQSVPGTHSHEVRSADSAGHMSRMHSSSCSGGGDGGDAHRASRALDAALYALYQFRKAFALLPDTTSYMDLENVMLRYVVPATRYAVGFLRARAVLVLATYARTVQWSSPSHFHALLHAVLPCIHDAELPVQIQTCMSFAALVRHRHARAVVAPVIGELMGHYFRVMRVMDNEAVVRTLRKTTELYHDTLVQWSCELTDMIVQHFEATLANVTDKMNGVEGQTASGGVCGGDVWEDEKEGGESAGADAAAEALSSAFMAADELLQTLITLVKSIPCSPLLSPLPSTNATAVTSTAAPALLWESVAESELEAHIANDTFVKIQNRLGSMLYAILSYSAGTSYGFMDASLQLIALLLSRSPAVTPAFWRLLPCLHELIMHGGASDYFAQMLPTLDNLVSVAPVSFWCTTMQSLCQEGDGGQGTSLPLHADANADAAAVNANGSTAPHSSQVPALVRAVGDQTPAQVVQAMCQAVLHRDDMRELEVAAVPKMVDAMLLHGWAIATTLLTAANHRNNSNNSSDSHAGGDGGVGTLAASASSWTGALVCRGETLLLSAAARLEQRRWWASAPLHTRRCTCATLTEVWLPKMAVSVTQQMLARAASTTAPASPLLRILLANSIFGAILADTVSTVQTLHAAHALQPFLAHYMHLALRPRAMSLLRAHDRDLFVLALAALLRCLHHHARHAQGPLHHDGGDVAGAGQVTHVLLAPLPTAAQTCTWASHTQTAVVAAAAEAEAAAAVASSALWCAGGEVDAALCAGATNRHAADAHTAEPWLLPRLLRRYAEADVAARRHMVERLERRMGGGRQSNTAEVGPDEKDTIDSAGAVDSEEDEEAWESDASEVDKDDDDDEEEEENDDDGDEEWDEDEDGDGVVSLRGGDDGQFQALIRQAQKLRRGRPHRADASTNSNKKGDDEDDDDEDDDEEWDVYLLDDEDVVSPIDTVNAWEVLSDAVQLHVPYASAATASHVAPLRVAQLLLYGDMTEAGDAGCATAVSQAAAMAARLTQLRDAVAAAAQGATVAGHTAE